MQSLPRRFRTEAANGLVAEWELRVGEQTFSIAVADHACLVREGSALRPDTEIATDAMTWTAIDDGRITGPQAFVDGALRVSGNLDLAVRLQTLFRPYRRARRGADLDQVEVEANGVRLSTWVLGKGRPIVLLHGLGASKISWVPLLGPLSERHRLIVPDLPGHGESEKPPADYTPRYQARVLRHLLDAMEVERAVIVGNSMGGRIALELALRSPNRVEALALLDPAMPGLRWRYLMGFTKVMPSEFGSIPFPLRRQWMERVLRQAFAHPERLPAGSVSLAAKEFIRIYGEPRARIAFLSTLRHVLTEPRAPFWASMRRVKHRALVVVGEEDGLVPARLGVRLAEALPNAELVLLPGVGHVPQFEATDATAGALLAFLAPPGRRTGAQP